MIENSTQGLTLLDPDRKVVVTGEEHHQAALVRWAPHPDGRGRRVAAELAFVTGPRGRRLIEVRIDGQRVGVLTPLMSERYAPHVHEVLRGRGRPACVAVVVHGRRGTEVEVHLPEVARDATAALPVAPVPVPPRPAPPAGAGAWPPPSGGTGAWPPPSGGSGGWPAPVPAPTGDGWPGNRPGPGGAPGPGGPGGRGPGRARRSRRPLWVGAGVLAALVVIGSTMSNHSGEVPTVSAAAPSTTRATPAPTTVPVTAAPTTVPAPGVVEEVEQVDVDVPDVDAPEIAPQAAARAPETRREPEPEPRPQALVQAPEPSGGGCHPSYSPCIPDGPDLDCGDIDGPVTVTGRDEYRLDANNDGVGCE
ncbi:hypothetical protein [Pseudonocardia broussonetiae]|uniref:Excalibur calcium-binding domain-containing protein n=1 Tax=Pseudonocardia broussonetiae TaxID=2736640 RepID=A0A6M6J9T1_9PSEU|nr:hypothetical protein [Pseudonocardia broussonetiae]QJY44406.1 hypothetical protein HOP40_03620 [Pseudonocardia broussonetiae]